MRWRDKLWDLSYVEESGITWEEDLCVIFCPGHPGNGWMDRE